MPRQSQIDPDTYREQLAADVHRDLNAMPGQGPIRLPETAPDGTSETPPPPEVPQPPPPAEAAAPAATPDDPFAPDEDGRVWGKYKNKEEARKGYYNLLSYATTAIKERKRLEAQLAEMAPLLTEPPAQTRTNGTPRVNPAERTGASIDWIRKDAVARFAEKTGIETTDLADFARAIHEESASTAQQAALEAITPLQIQTQAQSTFALRHPEAARFQPELAAFTERMEPLQKTIAQALWSTGQVYETMEYVWDQFQRTAAVDAESQMLADSQASEPKRVAAKQAAAVGSSSPGTPIHADESPENDPQYMRELAERARANDPDAQLQYRRLTFGKHLPASLRTWERG